MTDAKFCQKKKWIVGMILRGVESGRGPSGVWSGIAVIQITAIGVENILAHRLEGERYKYWGMESLWTLSCRDWEQVGFCGDLTAAPTKTAILADEYRPGEAEAIEKKWAKKPASV